MRPAPVLAALAALAASGAAAAAAVEDGLWAAAAAPGGVECVVRLPPHPLDGVAGPRAVRDTLSAHAERTQRGVRDTLARHGVAATSYWILNAVWARNMTRAALADVAAVGGGAARVRAAPRPQLAGDVAGGAAAVRAGRPTPTWNVASVGADKAWAAGHAGAGAVVGTIDSGVRGTHRALAGAYRGAAAGGAPSHDYNWIDTTHGWPPAAGAAAEPTDNLGHGTNVMGLLVGGTGLGVAPNASWVAARACTKAKGCAGEDVARAMQWMLCPTKLDGSDEDCSRAPHIVSNSWTYKPHDDTFQDGVDAWRKAGIIPVFAIGNTDDASQCSDAFSPGDYSNVIAAGAVNQQGAMPQWASKGPGQYAKLKPDFATPGCTGGLLQTEGLWTADSAADDAEKQFGGTSAATPVLAGIAALIRGGSPLTYDDVYAALKGAASCTGRAPTMGAPKTCGGKAAADCPNYFSGYGVPNACKAIKGCAAP